MKDSSDFNRKSNTLD